MRCINTRRLASIRSHPSFEYIYDQFILAIFSLPAPPTSRSNGYIGSKTGRQAETASVLATIITVGKFARKFVESHNCWKHDFIYSDVRKKKFVESHNCWKHDFIYSDVRKKMMNLPVIMLRLFIGPRSESPNAM
jgi:hypothetical protein